MERACTLRPVARPPEEWGRQVTWNSAAVAHIVIGGRDVASRPGPWFRNARDPLDVPIAIGATYGLFLPADTAALSMSGSSFVVAVKALLTADLHRLGVRHEQAKMSRRKPTCAQTFGPVEMRVSKIDPVCGIAVT